MNMNTFYFPNTEYTDAFFGSKSPVCVDAVELDRLADEWGLDSDEIRAQVHEATQDEIAEYGVYCG